MSRKGGIRETGLEGGWRGQDGGARKVSRTRNRFLKFPTCLNLHNKTQKPSWRQVAAVGVYLLVTMQLIILAAHAMFFSSYMSVVLH